MALRSGQTCRMAVLFVLILGTLWLGAACQEEVDHLPAPCRDIVLSPAKETDTVVTLLSFSARFDCWSAYGPAVAMQNNPELNIHVAVEAQPIDKSIYYQQTEEKLAAGTQPDLIVAGKDEAIRWFRRGYLASLAPCFERQPLLQEILPNLLAEVSNKGEPYAVPITTDFYALFYNKLLLKQLRWSDSQIATLPNRIADGTFTLFDLVQTAQQAINRGVIEPGYGIWSDHTGRNIRGLYPAFGGTYFDPVKEVYVFDVQAFQKAAAFGQSLFEKQIVLPVFANKQSFGWGDRLIQFDMMAQNRVLFWHMPVSRVTDLWHDYDLESDFGTSFGLALLPVATTGDRSSIQSGILTLVATPAAFRNEAQLEATCAVLAQTIKPENNVAIAAANFVWGVTKDSSASPAFMNHPLYQEINTMLDYVPYIPEWAEYESTLTVAMAEQFGQVELGNITPEEAANQVATIMETAFGNDVQILR